MSVIRAKKYEYPYEAPELIEVAPAKERPEIPQAGSPTATERLKAIAALSSGFPNNSTLAECFEVMRRFKYMNESLSTGSFEELERELRDKKIEH